MTQIVLGPRLQEIFNADYKADVVDQTRSFQRAFDVYGNMASVINVLTDPPANPVFGDSYYVVPGTGINGWSNKSGILTWVVGATSGNNNTPIPPYWDKKVVKPGMLITLGDSTSKNIYAVKADYTLGPFGVKDLNVTRKAQFLLDVDNPGTVFTEWTDGLNSLKLTLEAISKGNVANVFRGTSPGGILFSALDEKYVRIQQTAVVLGNDYTIGSTHGDVVVNGDLGIAEGGGVYLGATQILSGRMSLIADASEDLTSVTNTLNSLLAALKGISIMAAS